ncbi:MAG TPA: hypothetical protein VFH42_08475 [Sporolactobacillaceae bacterium]|nr:hypothetical protein [Sporolactobacillaceae bacterium]
MAPIVVSGLFWLVGILVILSGRYLYHKLQEVKKNLKEKAEEVKFKDNSASMTFQLSGEVLDAIPWYFIRLIFILVGMVIIALGFVPLGFLVI